MSSYTLPVLGLLSLTALAGAGVAVGSGVGMMYMQLANEEMTKGTPSAAVAHSPVEKKAVNRGFAASAPK